MARAAKPDWEYIKNYYIVGESFIDPITSMKKTMFPTLTDISSKFNLNYTTVRNRAWKEGWKESRAILMTKLKHKNYQDNLESLLSTSSQVDGEVLTKTRKIIKVVDLYLARFDSLLEELENDEVLDIDQLYSISPKDLNLITQTLDKAYDIAKRTYGQDKTDTIQLIEQMTEATKNKPKLSSKERQEKFNELQAKLKKLRKEEAQKEIHEANKEIELQSNTNEE